MNNEQYGSEKLIFDKNLLLPAGLTPQQGLIQEWFATEHWQVGCCQRYNRAVIDLFS